MSAQSYAPSPNLSELMRLFKLDDQDDLADEDGSPDLRAVLPPAPVTTTRSIAVPTTAIKSTPRVAQKLRGDAYPESSHVVFQRAQPSTSTGWNSSTQVAKTAAKPLKHQILCRNFVPTGPTVAVDRKAANQLLQRLSKATVSSRMKGTAMTPLAVLADDHQPIRAIVVDRKRMHLQQRHAASKQKMAGLDGDHPSSGMRSGREGIELLLFYRREVEKRLRTDPLYALHQDMQPY